MHDTGRLLDQQLPFMSQAGQQNIIYTQEQLSTLISTQRLPQNHGAMRDNPAHMQRGPLPVPLAGVR